MLKNHFRQTHILRVQCADQKGLIHKITGVLFRKQLNIIENAEFVDHENGLFFMRTGFSGKTDSKWLTNELRRVLPARAVVELAEERKKKIILFATKEAHVMGDLLLRHRDGELHANVLAVVSNHPDLKGLARAFGVPYHFIPHNGKSRQEHEDSILKTIRRYRTEYLVLAKYMRVFSSGFVSHFPNRIINIHHSFLPAFAGAGPYRQAAERGVKIIGATAHFVNENLDEGPIIAQGVIPVDHSHGVEDMARHGKDVEKMVLARALKLAFEDRIFVSGNKTILFD
jgi:formyltetrahydrofolate deformylase